MLTSPQITISRLDRADAARVVGDVFDGLSPASRRLRFHAPMSRLPAFALRRLANVDDERHVAIVAWADGEPIGISRFARTEGDEAELAIEVVDAWHGRGIGRQLLIEARCWAIASGYHRLVADVLAENAPVLHLLLSVFPDACVHRSRGVVRISTDIAPDLDGLMATSHDAIEAIPA